MVMESTDTNVKELSEKDKKLKAEIDGVIDRCLTGARKYFPDRENNRVRFEGMDLALRTKKEKWQSKYISPFPATSIEQKSAYLTEAATSLGPDFLEYLPYDNIEGEQQALLFTRLVAYYLSQTNVTEKIYLWSKDLLIYGTGVMKVFYNYRERMVKKKIGQRLSVGEDGQLVMVDAEEEIIKVEKDQPDFENVKLNNFWPDPDATCLDDMRYIVCRELITFSKISSYKKSRNLRNLDQAKKAGIVERNFGRLSTTKYSLYGPKDVSVAGPYKTERLADYDIDEIIKHNDSKNNVNPVCELLTIYRPGTVQLVLNGVPISEEEPYYEDIRFPFIVVRNQPLNGEFFGRSDMDIIQNNIRHHEEMANLIKDNYVEHLRPTRLVDMSLGQEAIKRLQNAGSGDSVAVPDINGIRELRADSFDTTAVNYSQGFLDEAKMALAINPLLEGQNPGSGIRSEGSLELFQQIGSTRMSLLVNMMAYQLSKLGEMFLQLVKQFGAEEIVFTVTGKLSESYQLAVRPVDIPNNCQVKVQLSAIADSNRTKRIQQMLQLIQTAAGMDSLGTFRSERAMVEVFVESRLFEDSAELYETNPEVINARAMLSANAAGKPQPTSPGSNPGPAIMQSMQQPQQFPGGPPPGPQAPPSNSQRPMEGNPQGLNQ